MGIRRGEITTKIVSDGLVFNMDAANRACYPRTGTTATDTIGNDSGTLNGTTVTYDTGSGVFNFDGSDDYINLGASADYAFGTNDFTICSWFNRTSTSAYEWIWGQGGTNFSWGQTNSNPGNPRVWINASYLDCTTAITLNTWQYWTCKRESGTVTFNLNGIDLNSGTLNGSIAAGSYLYMGTFNIGQNHFSGDIGPVHIYNRALSAEEVLRNYNGLRGRFGV